MKSLTGLSRQDKDNQPTAFFAFNDISLSTLSVLVIVILATSLAWTNRFVQDDAFISFRYAANLVDGKGLVYNEGERIEGYTNFLWTLLMTIPHMLDIDVVMFSYILSMGIFLLNLFMTYKLTQLLFGAPLYSAVALLLLGTNYTFSAYATGGLETGLQTFTLLAGTYILFRAHMRNALHWQDSILLSLIFSTALLTRLDSAIFIFALAPLLFHTILKQPGPLKHKIFQMVNIALPLMAIVGGWLAWKLWYYGDIFPNTYYAKASSLTDPMMGIGYLYSFLITYWLFPVLILFMASANQLVKKENALLAYLGFIIGLWFSYIIKIGGDFMEYRFVVLVIPLMFILVAWLTFHVIKDNRIRAALVAIILLGSFNHSFSFNKTTNFHAIDSITKLREHVFSSRWNWIRVGQVLHELFQNNNNPITIATNPAGAIPYYSGLKTVDMLGLNDRWIALHGQIAGSRPGHQRIATIDYLMEQKVNLVIGSPHLIPRHLCPVSSHTMEDLGRLWWKGTPGSLPAKTKFIEIPIESGYYLQALYLTKNSFIDEVIQTHQLSTYEIESSSNSRYPPWLEKKCRNCAYAYPKSAAENCTFEKLYKNL